MAVLFQDEEARVHGHGSFPDAVNSMHDPNGHILTSEHQIVKQSLNTCNLLCMSSSCKNLGNVTGVTSLKFSYPQCSSQWQRSVWVCRRLQLKKELKEAVPEPDSESAPSEAAEQDSDAAEEAREEALQGEMREVLDKAERRLKRERKRRREQRLKSRVRAAQMALSALIPPPPPPPRPTIPPPPAQIFLS